MTRIRCFLCEPDERLVFLRGDTFFAMLGLGPLGEGYSLIASNDHVSSMLDLDDGGAEELIDFTERLRAVLSERGYGPATLTEHGRVAACVRAATSTYEPHCLHAHRLVFPGAPEVDLQFVTDDVESYGSFSEAHRCFDWPGQYLYSEAPDGSCQIARAPRHVPRQLLRRVVARHRGQDAAADWQAQPGWDVVEAARRRLAG